jgi:hypothetical protein
MHPVCSCNEYISSHLPCPYVVGACNMHYGYWKKLEYLHPRWRLIDHPLQERQLRARDLDKADQVINLHDLDDAGTAADMYQGIYKTAFEATTAPSSHWFGTELRQHIERIITVVRSEDDFKTVTATLTVLQHKLERVAAGVARTPPPLNMAVKAATTAKAKVGTKRKADLANCDEKDSAAVGTKKLALKNTKRNRDDTSVLKDVGTKSPAKRSTKKHKTSEGSDAKQNDTYIRACVRSNGGLQNGLVIEVEPDQAGKANNHRWYMTITDGRLKKGSNGPKFAALTLMSSSCKDSMMLMTSWMRERNEPII